MEVGGGPGAASGAGGKAGSGPLDSAATSAMIEKEKHKLEVLKRRQERDIQQVGDCVCVCVCICVVFECMGEGEAQAGGDEAAAGAQHSAIPLPYRRFPHSMHKHTMYTQMLQYEVTRKQLLDKQQTKIDAMEARAAELRRQKAEHEKQWAVAQRERELAKVCAV